MRRIALFALRSENRIILIGLFLSAIFWIVDSVTDALIFQEESVRDQLFSPSEDELWARSFVSFLLIVFSFYSKAILADRDRTQMDLRQSDERYRDLYDNAPDMFASIDAATGRILECNNALLNSTSYSKEEIKALPHISRLYHPACEDVIKQVLDLFVETGSVYDVELQLMRKDGSTIDVSLNISAVRDEQGRIVRSRSILRDISERKRVQAALQESQARFFAFMKHLPGVAFMKDNRGRHVFVNENLEKMLGTEYVDWYLRTNSELFPPEIAKTFNEHDRIIIQDKRSLQVTELTNDSDGEHHWLVHKFPILNGEGELHLLGGIAIDITDRKRAELEREKLIEELEARNAEMERFTYTVSHDLKSPLITIKGFLGMLKDNIESGNRVGMDSDMSRISGAADRMVQLLDELLELSRVSWIVNPYQDVSLADLAANAVELRATQISEAEIQVDISPELPDVHGDQVRLQEVMQNLIDNAVKFTRDEPQPQIEIGTRQDGDDVICYVRDNGLGIDPRYHEKIFGLFEQLNPRKEGTGIGLAIVKRIIDVHGGRIWVESEGVGKGAMFCFTIPETIAEERPTLSK